MLLKFLGKNVNMYIPSIILICYNRQNSYFPHERLIIMKQFSYYLKTVNDLEACLSAFLAECPQYPSSILVSIFSSWTSQSDIHEVARRLTNRIPLATIVGATSYAEILNGLFSNRTTILSFTVFESSVIELHTFDLLSENPEDTVAHLKSFCAATPTLKGIGLLSTVNTPRLEWILKQLSEVREDVEIFGGCASIYRTLDNPYIFTDKEKFSHGIIAICFLGEDLHIRTNIGLGWKPLGRSLRITSVEGDRIVCKLNNNPAVRIYETYLKVTPKQFDSESLVFPFVLERDGEPIMRLPADTRADGSLIFTADCYLGETVRLSYGDPGEIINSSWEISHSLRSFAPQGMFIFSCMSRQKFLQNDTNRELRPFHSISPNLGFYSHGEIARINGKVILENCAIVTVAMREGKPVITPKLLAEPAKPQPTTMPLVQRLANFIAATTAELEEANEKLAKLAKLDRLTGIYNRGEIEQILQHTITNEHNGHRASDHLSAIMIDLDDFKKVNDQFGHQVGDQVLKDIAKVFEHNIRPTDSVGRWGGEEFLIILPGAGLKAAKSIAERIRKAAKKAPPLPDGTNVTLSIGIAEFPADGNFQSFYRHLDDALYHSKNSGKDRITLFDK